MNLRHIVRIIAYVDLLLTIQWFLGTVVEGTIMVLMFKLFSETPSLLFIRHGTAVIFDFVMCPLGFNACRRLLRASAKGASPESSIDLCKLWWKTTWISLGFETCLLMVDTFVLHNAVIPWNRIQVRAMAQFVSLQLYHFQVAYFVLQIFSLFCVYEFKQQMKSALVARTAAEDAMFPLHPWDSINNETQRSQIRPGWEYEELWGNYEYDPPPPYTLNVGDYHNI